MSIRVMSLVWGIHDKSLTLTEKMVLLRMADFAADDGSSIYPGLTRLEKDTSISRRGLRDIIHRLLEKNFLKKVREHSSKEHMANEYRINVPLLEALNTPSKKRTKKYIDDSPPGEAASPQPLLRTIINNRHKCVYMDEDSEQSLSDQKIPKQKKRTRFDEDALLTDEWIEIAKRRGIHERNIPIFFEEFKNYWTELTGPKALKTDWKKTWDNRCINLIKRREGIKPIYIPSDEIMPETRFGEDEVLTQTWVDIALDAGIHADHVVGTFQKFKNHYSTSKAPTAWKSDWQAAWQSWCIENVQKGVGTKPSSTPTIKTPLEASNYAADFHEKKRKELEQRREDEKRREEERKMLTPEMLEGWQQELRSILGRP